MTLKNYFLNEKQIGIVTYRSSFNLLDCVRKIIKSRQKTINGTSVQEVNGAIKNILSFYECKKFPEIVDRM